MRRRLCLLLGLVTLLVMVSGVVGSAAWFSDSAVTGVETVAAGKLNIDLIGGQGAAPFTLSDMEPGVWGGPVEINVYSDASTMPMKYRFYDTFDSQSIGGFYDLLNVRVYHWFAQAGMPGTWPASALIYDGALKDLYIESNGSPALNPYGVLPPNTTSVFFFAFEVDTSAGNPYQLAQATFRLTFDATQVAAPW